MNQILKQYNVSFNKPSNLDGWIVVMSVNEWMWQFIGDHYTLFEVNRVIAGITSVKGGSRVSAKFYTQSLQLAIITFSEVKIYEDMDEYEINNNIPPSFTLPTSDFLEIVKAWKEYLEVNI